MNYWPLSAILASPVCQHPGFRHEMAHVYTTGSLSVNAFETCGYVARNTLPANAEHLVIIESVRAAPRRMYTGYPDGRGWLQLERGGVVEASDGTLYVIIDALH